MLNTERLNCKWNSKIRLPFWKCTFSKTKMFETLFTVVMYFSFRTPVLLPVQESCFRKRISLAVLSKFKCLLQFGTGKLKYKTTVKQICQFIGRIVSSKKFWNEFKYNGFQTPNFDIDVSLNCKPTKSLDANDI